MSLGGLYVLNLRRPLPRPSPLAPLSPRHENGGAESPFESSTTSAGHRRCESGSGDRGGCCWSASDVGGDPAPTLAWVESVLGRGEGAVGPTLDVALVVVPCGRWGAGLHAGGEDAVGPAAGGGLEARVKVRIDSVRTDLSIPFVENLTRHVLSGALVSLLLENDGAAGAGAPQSSADAGSSASAAPPLPSPLPSVVPGRARALAVDNSTGVGAFVGSDDAAAAGDARARWEDAGGSALRQGGGGRVEGGSSWEHLVFIKVRMPVGVGRCRSSGARRVLCCLVVVVSSLENVSCLHALMWCQPRPHAVNSVCLPKTADPHAAESFAHGAPSQISSAFVERFAPIWGKASTTATSERRRSDGICSSTNNGHI